MASYISTVHLPLALNKKLQKQGTTLLLPEETAGWLFSQLLAVRAMRLASTEYEPALQFRANLFSVPPSRIATVIGTDRQPVSVRNLIPIITRMTTRVSLAYQYMSLETMLNTTEMDEGRSFLYRVNSGMLEPKLILDGPNKHLKMANHIFPLHPDADYAKIDHDMHFTAMSDLPIDPAIGLIKFIATPTGAAAANSPLNYTWEALLYLSTRRKKKRTTFKSGRKRPARSTGITVMETNDAKN